MRVSLLSDMSLVELEFKKLNLILISKIKLTLYNFSFTNYVGSQCCCVSNGMRQQLSEIKQAINDWKVNQTGESEVFRKEKQQLCLIGQEKNATQVNHTDELRLT